MLLVGPAADQLEIKDRVRWLDWSRENVFDHEGRPYDHSTYPHIGAPGGPADAFDCPHYLTIWLQWGSQLGKTFFGQAAFQKTADCDPCTMMFASVDQKLAVEVTSRTYRMLARCPPLRDQLRKESRRKQDCIDLAVSRCHVAWARSVSTLADKAVRFGHANEIDKWEHQSTSKEADPLKLFTDRFKNYPQHKKICEGTPALKHASRIERGRLGSTNCRYFVPCPHCGRYQALRMGNGSEPGGIVWDKTDAGKADKELARRTARYVCQHCSGEMRDQHRGPMMRVGVWAPEGCDVDADKARAAARAWVQADRQPWGGWSLSDWITGTPARDGRDAGYQLSSLYSLKFTWGDIAAEWIDSQRHPQLLRNFINQWLGETWEHVKRKATWESLGERLIDKSSPRFAVPAWASLLTLAVDRQSEGGERYPWELVAWGPGRRPITIAYGELDWLHEIESELLGRTYQHADGGEPIRIAITLVDSGHRPDGVYEFCLACQQKGLQVWPCKGSSTALDSDYTISRLGPNTAMPGMQLVHVDTIRSQLWLDKAIHDLDPEAGGLTIHSGTLAEHQDFLEQLINDAAVEKLDAHNNARESWERINQHIPNDYRDDLRYAYVAMLVATRGREILPRKAAEPRRSAVISSGATRPDGRPW